MDICYHCDGTGERDLLSGARCYECNGTGIKPEPPDDEYPCYWCDGTGDEEFDNDDSPSKTCHICQGSGIEPKLIKRQK